MAYAETRDTDPAGVKPVLETVNPRARGFRWPVPGAHRTFWISLLMMWGGYLVVRSAFGIAVGSFWTALWLRVIVMIAGIILTYVLWLIMRRATGARINQQIALLGVLAVIGGILLGSVEAFGNALFTGEFFKLKEEIGLFRAIALEGGWQAFLNVWVLVSWGGIYLGLDYSRRFQEERVRAAEAAALAHKSQLMMLRYQLNPHFLFNTLNALSALVLTKENGRAENMILALSKFLRHTLDSDPLTKVPLSKELWALGLYLDIEKERFGDRLKIERTIDPAALSCLVPSLLVQPIIENALKHAIANSDNGGTLGIAARRDGETLEIAISDTGPGLREPMMGSLRQSGVGLRNTMNRLERVYEGRASLDIRNLEPKGLEITFRLPAEEALPGSDDDDKEGQ